MLLLSPLFHHPFHTYRPSRCDWKTLPIAIYSSIELSQKKLYSLAFPCYYIAPDIFHYVEINYSIQEYRGILYSVPDLLSSGYFTSGR